MPRSNFRDGISQAITYVNSLASLDELGESAIKQGVVLRVLSAAGWDTFDLSQVYPEYRSGSTSIDFALMSSGSSSRSRGAATPVVFVEVKSPGENLESNRFERQVVSHCTSSNVPLGVLTNGLEWLLYSCSPETAQRETRFCEIDLSGDPDNAADELNRYLAKDRVVSGQAARSAERALQERSQNVVVRRAILEGWRQVVQGLDEGLIELVATASEQKAGERPENRFVRRVLMEHRSELLPTQEDEFEGRGTSGGTRRRPASFTFESETHTASSWPDLLVGVCELMRQRHPADFERILEVRGRSLPYFSRSEDEVHHPRQIGDSGIYASCQGAGVLIEARAKRVLELFGYPDGSLRIQTR